ncbi:MAG: cytochrome b5 domain-containing protein [Micropruina sp.]|nr:MAG: cytochrome b5 domain-containing protein [Micropruina sp.]
MLLPLEGIFDRVAGLPVHPLVVHAVVILIPLASIGLLICLLSRPLRTRYAGLVALGLAAGAGAALVAKESGEQLAERVGLPEQHATYGQWLAPVAGVAAVLTIVWWVLQRRHREKTPSSVAIVGGVAAVAGLAATVLTVLVGHSGATAVWTSALARDTPTVGSTAPSTGTVASPSGNAPGTAHTLAEVRQHASTSSCWVAVDGSVYDLTGWISRHPGGPDRIVPLCGTDASGAFHAQHGNQAEPNQRLAEFRIGRLDG